MAFDRPGRVLAMASSRHLVKLIDSGTGEELASLESPALEAVSALSFSPDGVFLAASSDGNGIRLWDLRRIRQHLARLKLDWPRPAPPAWSGGKPIVLQVRAESNPDIDPPALGTPARLIDLGAHYNAALTDAWHSGGRNPGNNLAAIPRGRQRLGGVEFDIRGVVQLAGRALAASGSMFPTTATNIPVGLPSRRLHFLHAAGWDEAPGKRIATYRVRFADGSTEEIPVPFDESIQNWHPSSATAPGPTRAAIAWQGTNALNRAVRVYLMTWRNPHPERPMATLDFISHQTHSAPFLIAITADP
jgi:hypothetical protein